ncbi:MAG TPA: hypothetical protein VKV39_18490 [Candidatus Sulfotelmatobacter sp.]|nr:hypothetical protein [Candidatus Sulfotelmatobacter sp.]
MKFSSILASLLMGGILFGQSAAPASSDAKSDTPAAAAPAQTAKPAKPSRYQPDRFAGRAGTYYRLVWGVDDLSVKSAEAGEVIRFTYKVLDADKAKTLNDSKIEPSLIDERAHVKLVVPQMDKVGKLRQSSTPQAGKIYWMLFSNKGGFVKRGDRVSVVIGKFRAEGLVVD